MFKNKTGRFIDYGADLSERGSKQEKEILYIFEDFEKSMYSDKKKRKELLEKNVLSILQSSVYDDDLAIQIQKNFNIISPYIKSALKKIPSLKDIDWSLEENRKNVVEKLATCLYPMLKRYLENQEIKVHGQKKLWEKIMSPRLTKRE